MFFYFIEQSAPVMAFCFDSGLQLYK